MQRNRLKQTNLPKDVSTINTKITAEVPSFIFSLSVAGAFSLPPPDFKLMSTPLVTLTVFFSSANFFQLLK